MITFALGVSATILVGMLVWFTVDILKMLKKIKHLERLSQSNYSYVESRLDGIIHLLDQIKSELNKRVDENYSYTDSRFDKLENKLTNKK
jgi:hypothetical protein